MKGPIESLGKANKSFLIKYFKFYSIRWAKHRLGVDNDKEAYDIMKEVYNGIITEKKAALVKEKKIEKRAKMRFLNVLEQLGQRKKAYTVAITIQVKKVYKDKKQSVTYGTEFVEKTYLASNDTELENKIDDETTGHYPYEDSPYICYLVSYKYTISQTKTHTVHKLDVPMKKGKPVKASFLKYSKNIDPVSYEDYDGECVLRMLLKHMDIKKDKTLIRDFNEASLTFYNEPYDKKKGITSRMILHMCQQRNISCLGFDQREKNFVKFTADQNRKRKFRPIVFYMFMSHFYLITDSKTILSISSAFRQNNNVFHSSLEIGENTNKVEDISFYSNLPVSECLNLPDNSVVIFDKCELNNELREYIELTNDIPSVKNNTITQVGQITFGENKNKKMVISGALGEGLEWGNIMNLCNKAEIKFNNQSLGQLICQIRDKFFIMKRAKFTNEQRELIKKEQDNKCVKCKLELPEKYHIDHIEPLSAGGNNERENLQALCVSCHIEKSREEKEACEYIQTDNITSAFNIQSLEAIESNFFRKVAFSEPIGNIDKDDYTGYRDSFSKDMNKCRRNILLNYGMDFPRYSVLDDVEIFDGKLETGFYYIETENTFPLRQNGFYSYPLVKYCLDENLIETKNIKYQLKPSFHIESDYFKDFVEHLDSIFEENDYLKKLAVNSLVGLFGRRKNTFVENRICSRNESEEIACAYEDFHKPYLNVINDDIIQVAGQSEVKKIESAFPIHAQVLDCEAIELHKLVNKIKLHGGIPYEVKTDAVNYFADEIIDFDTLTKSIFPQGDTQQQDNFWDDEYKLPKYKDEAAKDLVKSVIINNDEKYEIQEHKYQKVEESDDYTALAETVVKSNKGCLILGPAGTGKTYLINEIKKHLEAMELKFKCVAPTNKAALLMNGETLHKFSYSLLNSKKQLKKYKSIKYLLVDEISMVQEIFYQVMMMLKHYNPDLKLIISGDFGQLPPVNDRVNRNYEMTRALWELVDGNQLELTKCKRSDDTHFNNCMNVRNGKNIDLNKFKKQEETYLNICFTNQFRKTINQECMIRFLEANDEKDPIIFEPLIYDKNSQTMAICEGMPIIARVNEKSFDIVNNEMFIVKHISDEFITVSNDLKLEINIPKNKFNKLFYLAFCITIHKSQGATFNGKYTIYEWLKQNRKMKYVALSRATDEKNIQIVI